MQLAGCIIRDKDNKVLLMHRSTPDCTQWEMPGGKVEPGEALDVTAVREIKEELGVDIELLSKLGGQMFEEENIQFDYHWFEAWITNGRPYLAEPDTFDDLRYFSLDEMKMMSSDLSANTRNFLEYVSNPKSNP